jgi:hypothetical protein
MHQQLVFRPLPGTGRPEAPVAGLFLASAGAHLGGGVHGALGANAAHAALRTRSPSRVLSRAQRPSPAATDSATGLEPPAHPRSSP